MRIAVCAAYKVGLVLTKFITNYPGNNVVFYATCDRDDSEYADEIKSLLWLKDVKHYSNVNVNSPKFIALLKEHEIDVVLLLWWPTIVKQEALDAVKTGWINLHPSLLPYNQGKHPWYWNIAEGTPFGVTIHFINADIDKGDILFQREIPVNITDTGESVYARSIETIIQLFKESFPAIVAGELNPKRQGSRATFHWGDELDRHTLIELNKSYLARDLLNRIRGRSFRHGDSAYFFENGKKYFIRISIEEA